MNVHTWAMMDDITTNLMRREYVMQNITNMMQSVAEQIH